MGYEPMFGKIIALMRQSSSETNCVLCQGGKIIKHGRGKETLYIIIS